MNDVIASINPHRDKLKWHRRYGLLDLTTISIVSRIEMNGSLDGNRVRMCETQKKRKGINWKIDRNKIF